ncbi:MAG: redoxin domain-containing protein, partial [Hymenobacter sp.]
MLQLGDQAPDFSLPTGNGDTFRLADQRGKAV